MGPRAVPRRRAEAARRKDLVDRFREDAELPGVPVDRRRRRRAEPAARLGRGQHGPALEPGRAGAAHRPRASPGPEAAGAGRQLRRPGHDRGRHAVGAEVQEVAVRRRAGRRRERGVPGRQPAQAFHGRRRAGHDSHPRIHRRGASPARRSGGRRGRWRGPRGHGRPAGSSGPWTGLLQAGLELLGRMAATADGSGHPGRPPLPFERERDQRTGQTYLKIRMPEPAVVDRVADALQALLASLRS